MTIEFASTYTDVAGLHRTIFTIKKTDYPPADKVSHGHGRYGYKLHHHGTATMRVALALLIVALFLGVNTDPRTTTPLRWISAAQAQDLPLQTHQGQYFRVAAPSDWRINETANGIEVIAPDEVTGTAFSILMGGFGHMNPYLYLTRALRTGPYTDPQIESINDLPNQPGPMGMPWQVIEAEVHFGYRDVPMRAHVTVGVIQGFGEYSAVLRAHQAPARRWSQFESTLAAIDSSVIITNAQQVAGLDRIQLPKSTSHDEIYGDYNRGYEQRQQQADARSQKQHETTMGYARMRDPVTGQLYDMPHSAYDPSLGGYRNPMRPTELLEPAAPGE